MRLTAHILDQVSWWEHTSKRGYMTASDVFVLHFKAWWRPRKVITIPRLCTGINGDIYTLTQSDGARELLRQLNSYLTYPGSDS